MKKISLFCFSLCAMQVVHADPFMSIFKKKDAKHHQFIHALTAGYTNGTAAKSTTLKERVIAQSYVSMGQVDSTRFIYKTGNQNGSQFDYNALHYAVQFSYGNQVFIEGVNGAHARPYVFADVAEHYNNYNGPFGLSELNTITYDVNGNITVFDDSFFNAQNGATIYVSNYSQQNITNSTTLYNFGSSSDTGALRFFRYNQGHIAADSTYQNFSMGTPGSSLTLGSRNDYTYDNAGNLTKLLSSGYDLNTQALTPGFRYLNTYTVDNRLKTSIAESYNGSSWDIQYVDSFGYTTNIPFYTYSKETVPSSPVPTTINYHTTNAGVVDSVYGLTDTGNNTPANIKLLFTYDSYNNPVTAKLFYGQGTIFSTTPSEHFNYYYETYQPSAVNNVANIASNVHVYPNPVHNELYVSGLTGIGNIISLVNMAGQTVMTQITGGNSLQTVSLGGIAAGNYVLRVSDAAGNKVHAQTVVKQ
jgi:hypothetical protein